MGKAKYYIYRNLHTNTFSVRYKGKVIDHPKDFTAYNVDLKVNEKTRLKVLSEHRKKVHAFVACDSYVKGKPKTKVGKSLYYNPYTTDTFLDGKKSIHKVDKVVGVSGKNIFKGCE